ncbi:MAG: histidine phosphatase family protein [Pseudoclavibacter sp.]
MTLALVRHGRTAWNLERRLQGRSDIALDAHGELQAHAAGRLLARAQWGRVVTSPLTRAAQTASIIWSYLGSPAGAELNALVGAHARSPIGSFSAPDSCSPTASRSAPDAGSPTASPTASGTASPAASGTASHLGVIGPLIEPGLLERDFGEAEGMQVAEAAERWPAGDYPGSETSAALGERAGAALTSLLAAPGTAVVVSHGVFLRAGIEAVTGVSCPRILNGQVVLIERTSGRPTARFLGE